MKIFNKEPNDWRDLQEKVAIIFRDMNCDVAVEKDIETVRGIVNIDVYAEDRNKFPTTIYLCECKNWSNAVPQSVVHSFTTVVNNFGGNCGYIISKAGFQSGAYRASENTNISLLTWNEFLNLVEKRWLTCMSEKLDKIGKVLRDYSDLYSCKFYKKVKEKDSEVLKQFNELCQIYYFTSLSSSNLFILDSNREVDKEILDKWILDVKKRFEELNNVTSYSEYFYFLIDYCQKGVKKFDRLFGERLCRGENI